MLEASRLLDWILEFIKATLQSGESIMIAGFGKFTVRSKHARQGRNPQTGEAIRPENDLFFVLLAFSISQSSAFKDPLSLSIPSDQMLHLSLHMRFTDYVIGTARRNSFLSF